MTDTEKRLVEIREYWRRVSSQKTEDETYLSDAEFLLSIIDDLRAENERLRNHPAIIAFPEQKKSVIY